MDIGENPDIVPMVELQVRGIMGTSTSSMTSPLNSDQEASGIFPINENVSEILPSTSSKSSPSWKTSFSQRYGQNVYPSFESGGGTADLFLVRCCLIC